MPIKSKIKKFTEQDLIQARINTIQTTIDYLEEVKSHLQKWGMVWIGCDYFPTEPKNYDDMFKEKKKSKK